PWFLNSYCNSLETIQALTDNTDIHRCMKNSLAHTHYLCLSVQSVRNPVSADRAYCTKNRSISVFSE
ncbi:MAG TPA: hypothetical protein PKW69_00410, partial [Niabella sp.]|nr:hypothetical protein [Niabella sp.]